MKYFFTLLAMLCSCLMANAVLADSAAKVPVKSVDTDYQQDAQLISIIETLRATNVMQGRFAQARTMKGMSVPIRSQGIFVFWREHGLYQEAQQPFFNAFTITPTQLINWTASGKGEAVNEQSALVQREINKTLLSFFNTDIAVIQQRFSTRWDLYDDGHWHLVMTPKLDVMAKHMQRIELKGSARVDELTIEASGDITQIRFSEQVETAVPTAQQCEKFTLNAAADCVNFGD